MDYPRTHAAVGLILRDAAAISLFAAAGLTPIVSAAGPNDVPVQFQVHVDHR